VTDPFGKVTHVGGGACFCVVRYDPYLMGLDPSVPQNLLYGPRSLRTYDRIQYDNTLGRGVFLDGHATPHPKETGQLASQKFTGPLFASTRFDPELPNSS